MTISFLWRASLIAVCVAVTTPTKAVIPPGETWSVPDNESWRQFRVQLQSEYRLLLELMHEFPRDRNPETYEYCSARAFGIGWAYPIFFGVPIPGSESVAPKSDRFIPRREQ